jgi:hypothetical protein
MKGIFIKVAFRSDENVLEKSAQVLAKLNDVKNLHDMVGLIECGHIS